MKYLGRLESAADILVLTIFVLVCITQAQYSWPVQPIDESHYLSGTFCEYRDTGSVDHFHNGVDIPKPDGSAVYAVADGTVSYVQPSGSDSYVRVGRFCYIHIIPNPSLSVGSHVLARQTVVGTIRPGQGHTHFIDGYYDNETNAIRAGGGLTPYYDPWAPVIKFVRFYQDDSDVIFLNNRIFGKVDIVVHIKERNGPNGSGESYLNNGSYQVGFKILSQDRTQILFQPSANSLKYRFDSKPNNRYVNNVYVEKLSTLSQHVYNLTNNITRNNFWDTSRQGPGQYVVMVWTKDTRNNADTVFVAVEVAEEDREAPIPPVLKFVRSSPSGFDIAWYQNPEDDLLGYRLYYSNDLNAWRLNSDETRLGAAVEQRSFSARFQNPLYFRLSAVDNSPTQNESLFSDVYAIRNAEKSHRALVVDGFDRYGESSAWSQPTHDFVQYYAKALAANGIFFDVCSNDAIIDSSIRLNEYDMVFWMLGDESGVDESFSVIEQQRIADYLTHGGNLSVSGSEAAFDLAFSEGYENASDSSFAHHFLKSEFGGQEADTRNIVGSAGSIFDGMSFTFGNMPYSVSASDVVVPVGGGLSCLTYQNSGLVAGIQFEGSFDTSDRVGKLIYLCFPFETIMLDAQTEVMSRVVNFFMSSTEVEQQVINSQPTEFKLFQNYPNPFRLSIDHVTHVVFQLPKAAQVRLRIFNLAGQLVREVFKAKRQPGSYQVQWDGRDTEGKLCPSGVYLCQMRGDNFLQTRRLLILR